MGGVVHGGIDGEGLGEIHPDVDLFDVGVRERR